MKEMFDLDYLSKDLTGNSEIQSAIDRCLAFMKLEKWEKSLQIIEDLTDMHPESPAAWFTRARLATNDFTIFTLATPDGRKLVSEASESLQATMTFADEERKDEYARLQATFADRMKKELVERYVGSFKAFVDACENFERLYSNQDYRMFAICDSFSKAAANEDGDFDENTIYKIPPEIIIETGKDYPSITFAALHIIIMNEVMKPYFEAQKKQAQAKAVQEARFEQRRNWNQRQGFGHSLDRSEMEDLSRLCPVYDLSHYYKYSIGSEWSLAKLITDNSVFDEAPFCDNTVKEVFESYFKFMRILKIPIGDLRAAGIPDVYYKEIVPFLQEMSDKEREQKQLRAIAEHEEYVRKEKAREEAATREAEHKSKRIKLLFVCLFFGTFGVHNFMMGEKKKGAMKILLFWTGLSSLIATVDFFKLLFDTYDIP